MKSTKFKPALTAVSLALLASLACAQTDSDALRQAAQQAINSSPDVTSRFNTLRAAIQEVDVARGGYLPRVDLSAEVGRERNKLTTRTPNESLSFARSGATLSVDQMLWDGLATKSEVERLGHARMTRYFEFVDATEQAALEASRAYYDVMRYRKLVELAEENYVQHKSIFNQIQSRAKAGVGRGVDSEQANARLALADSNLSTEIANLHDVTARYLRVVGSQPPTLLPQPGDLSASIEKDDVVATKAALAHNPSISAAIENLRAAREQAKGRDSAFQPRVGARLSTGAGNNYLGNLDEKRDSQALLQLNWNLYNGGSDRARVKQYASLVEQAADQRDKACRDVRQTFSIAHNDIGKLQEQIQSLDRNVLSIQKARDAYRQQFDIGQRSLLDLLNAENELYTAKRALANAQFDLSIAQARTLAAAGNLSSALSLSRPDDADAASSEHSVLNKIGLGQTPKSSAQLAASWNAGSDAAERCPVETEVVATTSRVDLDTRANAYNPLMPAALPAATASEGLAEQRLRDWAAAWMSKDVDRYMTFYSKDFKSNTMSTQRWMSERRRLVGKKGPIDVTISNIRTKQTGPDTVETAFDQSYTSNDFKDQVTKTLTWKQEGTQWNIIHESNR